MKIFTLAKKSESKAHEQPIVLIHGSWGASWMWNMYIPYFTQHGWDVYAPDLQGHGQSEGNVSGATMQNYVDNVAQSINENNLQNPIIIGHSMGGLVALMYAIQNKISGVVAIDPSKTKEVQGDGEEKTYLEEYMPTDAGMPTAQEEVMKAFPDLSPDMLMNMKKMLGGESGVARSERKCGISVPKESLTIPTLFVGGEKGTSVPFGIGIEVARKMAEFYEKEVIEVKGATHPGILMGKYSADAVMNIEAWVSKNIS